MRVFCCKNLKREYNNRKGGRYDNAKRLNEVLQWNFKKYGFPLVEDNRIIPDDNTTLFICSGMQQLKDRFLIPDGTVHGSIQNCIRTNDLEVVGDGSHLTHFKMIGNFSFGGDRYEMSCEMWKDILKNLEIPVTHITFHPSQDKHYEIWKKMGFTMISDESNVWSDGNIGGYCCEVFVGNLEIGNLVNTMGHSVDVGFGLERLIQIMENKERVDNTSLFIDGHPILKDHVRSIDLMWDNNIFPSGKGRNFVCKKMLRRILDLVGENDLNDFKFREWIQNESLLRDSKVLKASKCYKKYKDRDDDFWFSTYGVWKEEVLSWKEKTGK